MPHSKTLPEEVVHTSLSDIAMSRVQQIYCFPQPIFNLHGRGDGALQVLVAGV